MTYSFPFPFDRHRRMATRFQNQRRVIHVQSSLAETKFRDPSVGRGFVRGGGGTSHLQLSSLSASRLAYALPSSGSLSHYTALPRNMALSILYPARTSSRQKVFCKTITRMLNHGSIVWNRKRTLRGRYRRPVLREATRSDLRPTRCPAVGAAAATYDTEYGICAPQCMAVQI